MRIVELSEGESIRIGDDIRVEVVIAASQSRIGIEAPRDVAIVRAELIAADEPDAAD